MAGEQRARYFHLSGSLKKVGKFVGRGRRRSIAQAVVGNLNLRQHVVEELTRTIRKEVKELCSRNYDTILRMKTKPALQSFTWQRIWDELDTKAPLLLTILTNCLPKKKGSSDAVKPALCMCASILLKLTNPHVNLAQGVLSVVLRAGHTPKQVQ